MVVDAIIIIIPSLTAVRILSTDARHTIATLRCSRRRMMSPHHRQAGTFNLLMHDDVRVTKVTGSIGSPMNQGAASSGVEIDLPGGDAVEASRRF
jgi:hypothetical protein